MAEIPREWTVWMSSGSAVLVLAWMYLISIVVMIAGAIVIIGRAYLRYKRSHEVICPDNGICAALKIAPGRAAIAALFGEREFVVLNCSQKDGAATCDHGCTRQLIVS